MRRTKSLLWLPFALAGVINFFTLLIAGILSNTVASDAGSVINVLWWLWLLLFTASLVLLGCWVAYWRRLPS